MKKNNALNASSNDKVTRQIFVTGGVASSLGKGLSASSLGQLLRARGLSVTMQKFDPYLNVDPGTITPSSTVKSLSPTTVLKPTSTSDTTSASWTRTSTSPLT